MYLLIHRAFGYVGKAKWVVVGESGSIHHDRIKIETAFSVCRDLRVIPSTFPELGYHPEAVFYSESQISAQFILYVGFASRLSHSFCSLKTEDLVALKLDITVTIRANELYECKR